MRLFNNLRLGIKLGIGFGILVICMLAIGLFGFQGMSKLKDEVTSLATVQTVAVTQISQVDSNMRNILAQVSILVNENLASLHSKSKEEITRLEKETIDTLQKYSELNTNTIKGKTIVRFADYRQQFVDVVDNIVKSTDSKDFKRALDQYMTLADIQEKLLVESNELIKENANDAVISLTDSINLYNSLKVGLVCLLTISGICTILIIIVIVRFIGKSINDIIEVSESMSHGDLTKRIEVATTEQFGKLGNALNIAIENMNTTIEMISSSSTTLNGLVGDCNNEFTGLNGALQDTSAAAQQLSASMEETASSAEEMNSTSEMIETSINTVSEKAQFGAKTAEDISARASNLKENFTKSKTTSEDMFREIKTSLENSLENAKSIKKIDDLAVTILGITKKTNLLALNAAIEAARAGEAGKGFTVVADEIRGLATSSKAAVEKIQEVTEIVVDSVKGLMEDSNKLLQYVGTDVTEDYVSMLEATDIYAKDSESISDIATNLSSVSKEVSASTDSLMRAIKEVATAANQGAITTELVAEKATEMTMSAAKIMDIISVTDRTAEELKDLISNFKLK